MAKDKNVLNLNFVFYLLACCYAHKNCINLFFFAVKHIPNNKKLQIIKIFWYF